MTDDLTKRRPQDASKININEPWEITYWTQALGVSAADLIKAVAAVGVSVIAVKKHLGK